MNASRCSRRLASLLALVALGAWSGATQAALISLDSAFGPDTITLDTDTGMQWLDLDVTTGRSFNDVAAQFGEGGEFEGFRHATAAEVLVLWTNAGIPDITFEGPIDFGEDFTQANFQPALDLIAFIGQTLALPTGPLSEGFTSDPGADPATRIVGELNVCDTVVAMFCQQSPPDSALASLGPHLEGEDDEINFIGHYLVLEQIPVPPALWLLGTALAVLGFSRRRPA